MSVIAGTRKWAEMVKFSHSVFALPFALLATFMAGTHLPGGHPRVAQVALILLCMVSARSLAMTFNRIADARIDALNPRTAQRHLPAGRMTLRQAWVFFGIAVMLFLAGSAGFAILYCNAWPILLAIPVILYLCGYSYSKRFTRWSHLYLGSAIAVSPAAAWLAIHPPSIGLSAVLLVLAVTLWIGGFDIIYACQDIAADRQQGLYSLPANAGPRAALRMVRCAHFGVVLLLAALGFVAGFGILYWIGVAAVATLLLVENAIVHPRDFSKVNMAFFTLNGTVSVLLGLVGITDILLDLDPLFLRAE